MRRVQGARGELISFGDGLVAAGELSAAAGHAEQLQDVLRWRCRRHSSFREYCGCQERAAASSRRAPGAAIHPVGYDCCRRRTSGRCAFVLEEGAVIVTAIGTGSAARLSNNRNPLKGTGCPALPSRWIENQRR